MKQVTLSLVFLLAASSLAALLDDRAFIGEAEYKDYVPDITDQEYVQNEILYKSPDDDNLFLQERPQSYRRETKDREDRNENFDIRDKVFSLLGLSSGMERDRKTDVSSSDEDTEYSTSTDLKDEKHGIKMGIPVGFCDDAKTNLTVDWDGSPVNYTCYTSTRFPVNLETEPRLECEKVPRGYFPQHHCMNSKINYSSRIPTFGDHRPLWPKYGEYRFTPPQRWLHNIEHGAVVMLYHPCAQPLEVDRLRKVVKSCIRKYIITPYILLEPERPLALVAWGCRLLMSLVNEEKVQAFIMKHALKGPEGTYAKDGQYVLELVEHSVPPPGSDEKDSILCPSRRRKGTV